MASAGLTAQQKANADLITKLGENAGLTPDQATQLVGAAYAESGLNENAVNSKNGAFGLFQLLSQGYVNSYHSNIAQGQDPATANIEAILPKYAAYWKAYPNAPEGQAAAAVEASGEPASWYASATGQVSRLYEGASGSADFPGGLVGSVLPSGAGAAVGAASQAAGDAITNSLNPFKSLTDFLNFIASYRFLEIIGGGALILVGLIGLMKEIGVSVPAPGPVGKAAAAVG